MDGADGLRTALESMFTLLEELSDKHDQLASEVARIDKKPAVVGP